VNIIINDPMGNMIEQGDAVMQINEIDWLYITTMANETLGGSQITATATDLTGNKDMICTDPVLD
jgi:hypothetical protein